MECPSCDSRGCESCGDTGEHVFTKEIFWSRDIVRAVDCFALMRKGVLPVGGGYLDQSATFLDAFSFFENEKQVMSSASE